MFAFYERERRSDQYFHITDFQIRQEFKAQNSPKKCKQYL